MKEQKDKNLDTQKRSYQFALNVIKYCKNLSKDTAIQIIIKQLIRCATSVGANIIEAQASSLKKDFTNFLNHSLKSANEAKFWLHLVKDSLKKNDISDLIDEANQIFNILGKSLITLRGE